MKAPQLANKTLDNLNLNESKLLKSVDGMEIVVRNPFASLRRQVIH